MTSPLRKDRVLNIIIIIVIIISINNRIFDFKMDNDAAKHALCKKLSNLLDITSSLKIKSQLKLRILHQYIYSQISHELKMYPLGDTWIDQNLDSIPPLL